MKLEITKSKKAREIKDRFNKNFPFLKIEFFSRQHAPGEATPQNNLIKEDITLGQINQALEEGSISISSHDSVSSLEQAFQEKFGLSVQVFRKQKTAWIETTRTDLLTLEEQNKKGQEACSPMSYTEPGDRYLEDGQY